MAKIPVSVLVVIYTRQLDVLLLERADHPGFWQSVTGSLQAVDESLAAACLREVREETGWVADAADLADWQLQHRYAIYAHWRHRYDAQVTHNIEHVFGLAIAHRFEPTLAPGEHLRHRWLPWREAADACFSWTNAQAIRRLGEMGGDPGAVRTGSLVDGD
jgi:dihydroneopterin triphosphate diphosphatase